MQKSQHRMNSQHSEFELEAHRLAHCIQYLESQISSRRTESPDAGDDWANKNLLVFQQGRVEAFSIALNQPYFGRLDFWDNDEEAPEEFYIGKIGLQPGQIRVVDWRAPLATLFYLKGRTSASYKAAKGTITGQILLKRHLEIDFGKLRSVKDEIDLRQRATTDENEDITALELIDPDEYLRTVLEGKQGQGLREIVATIQEAQNDLIRADADQVLIVQGAAGSGKTTVALHRIAYLLYPQEGAPLFRPERMLIVGSNAVFLSFVGHVLPSLGIQNIPQMTFIDWALVMMGQKGNLEVSDKTLVEILDQTIPHDVRTQIYRRSRLKGSSKMHNVLDAAVNDYRSSKSLSPDGITIHPVGEGSLDLTYAIPKQHLAQLFSSTDNLPVNQQRRRVTELATDYVMQDHENRYRPHGTRLRQRVNENDGTPEEIQRLREMIQAYTRPSRALSALRQEVGRLISVALEKCWPHDTVFTLYHRLLSDSGYLKSLIGKRKQLEEYHRLYDADRKPSDWRFEDIAPIFYLYLQLEGDVGGARSYDHIVVDEAQDLSPFQIWLLRQFVANGSMTILGDLAQSIHSYRGISRWSEFVELFQEDKHTYFELTRSYRATYEVMSFGNQIIDRLNEKSKLGYRYSEPFPRHGPAVTCEGFSEADHLLEALSENLNHLSACEYQSCAVICKDVDEARSIHKQLITRGHRLQLILSPETQYEGKFVVLPVHLTKGLEFQGCIVSNANSHYYTETELDGRLLYVAITRALHELFVLYTSEPSPHLPQQ